MRFTGTVCRMCKSLQRFFLICVHCFKKRSHTSLRNIKFFLSQLKAIFKNSKFIDTQFNTAQVNQTNSISFQEKNNKPMFRMSTDSTNTTV